MSRKHIVSALLLFISVSVAITSCSKTTEGCDATVDCNGVTFSGTIQPLAASKCALSGCHGGSFDSYPNLSGLANSGELLREVVTTEDMPAGNIDMTCEQRAQFECWIDAGAPNN